MKESYSRNKQVSKLSSLKLLNSSKLPIWRNRCFTHPIISHNNYKWWNNHQSKWFNQYRQIISICTMECKLFISHFTNQFKWFNHWSNTVSYQASRSLCSLSKLSNNLQLTSFLLNSESSINMYLFNSSNNLNNFNNLNIKCKDNRSSNLWWTNNEELFKYRIFNHSTSHLKTSSSCPNRSRVQ